MKEKIFAYRPYTFFVRLRLPIQCLGPILKDGTGCILKHKQFTTVTTLSAIYCISYLHIFKTSDINLCIIHNMDCSYIALNVEKWLFCHVISKANASLFFSGTVQYYVTITLV